MQIPLHVQCVTGRQRPADPDEGAASHQATYTGGILSDEMGLGKTLQVLATSWTLIQRGGRGGKGLVRKVLVVAPSSVIANWGQEIKKWLGIGVEYLVLQPGKDAATQVRDTPHPVRRCLAARSQSMRCTGAFEHVPTIWQPILRPSLQLA